MMIDWAHFSPGHALLGGVLIGLAAGAMLLLLGRIAGISGILGGLLQATGLRELGWRGAFLIGLVAAPLCYQSAAPLPMPVLPGSQALLLLAGLLVGYGSRLGSGCTSGHGVCGLARLSPRSVVATLTFMAAGFATVYVVRHVL